MADAPFLVLDGVSKRFGDRAVLDRFSLEIEAGEFLTLLGPSGCGKTTILRLIAGFETPDEGDIRLRGASILPQPPEARRCNTVFQSYALFPHLSVRDNVAFGLLMSGVRHAQAVERAEATLARVRLGDLAERRPHQLSGGQQQRVALARALVNGPEVLLLDEPLSALDYKLRKEMQHELTALQRELGTTFILVTHDQEEALALSDRLVVMRDGDIQQLGTPRAVYERPANHFVADFVGEANLLPARILARDDDRARVRIGGVEREIAIAADKPLGDRCDILLRPEDLRVYAAGDQRPTDEPLLPGRVISRIYKGKTLDSVIELDDGTRVLASEFFDEDYPAFDHEVGETVDVGWVPGWEWVLPPQAGEQG